jgi:Sel1 repeat
MTRFGLIFGVLLLSTNTVWASFEAGRQAYQQKNYNEAVTLWKKAAGTGDLNAQYNLGILYEKGAEGISKDLGQAYAWYRLAAAQNVSGAQEAISRLKPILTAGQIESGDKQAISVLGKWYRQNVGMSEEQYQQILAARKQKLDAKKNAEKLASEQRARQRRALIAQRDAEAKLALVREEQSRQQAITAARQQAEDAKQKAYKTEQEQLAADRLAAAQGQQREDEKMAAAKLRIEQLKAKQQSGAIVNESATVTNNGPVPTPAPTAAVAQKPIDPPKQQSSSSSSSAATTTAVVATQAAPTSTPAPKGSTTPAPSVSSATVVTSSAASTSTPVAKPAPTPTPVAQPKTVAAAPKPAPVPKPVAQPKTVAAAPEPVPASEPVPTSKPAPAPTANTVSQPEPKTVATAPAQSAQAATPKPVAAATVAAVPVVKPVAKPVAPVATPAKLPVISNGMDEQIVQSILQSANSVPLDTPNAKSEILAARTEISALKWSLISSARGKASAAQMNSVLIKNMTPVQIAEANRQAAEWINKRMRLN